MENIGKFGRRVRVVVVGDEENTHLRLKSILQSREGFIFAGEFFSGKEALTGDPASLAIARKSYEMSHF
jgi:hypothetical protein